MRYRPGISGEEYAAMEDGYEQGQAVVRGLRFRVEVACDGYENLTPEDVPHELDGYGTESYIAGAAAAARAIRGVLQDPT